ncbi:MAG: type II secretion system protein GspG [Gemmatimonadota bacterium]
MNRIVAIILVVAIIFAVPPLRARGAVLMEPVIERLGPVGDAIANPIRRYSANNKVKHVLNVIDNDRELGRRPPPKDPEAFNPWMRRRVPEDTGLDPWGNQYWMQYGDRTVTIGSNGPDGVRGTEDDVAETAPH